ncbi:unnamed protein product [Cuscuta campestris]|uniref:N(6)-L-threonylcarbamoyladenine synthase n=1 Tax=Cuscuta campestris TaxID=132261 RepID=A0A484LHA6_9ASTE|nr:unnamed protein product [Cuscuta campestris]
MTMGLPSLSWTISRLHPLQRSSLYLKIRAFKNLGAPQRRWPETPWHVLPASPKPLPALFSSSSSSSSSYNLAMAARRNQQIAGESLVILGIETSCDDTAAAVVNSNGDILSQVISSQAELLAKYGGVAPKMAEEAHLQVIDQVVQEALNKARLTEKDLTAVAVTIGPGLSLCLRVGIRKARQIAGAHNLPIVGVHHMEAHTLVARLVEREMQFPFMALLVSGNTSLLKALNY